MQQSVRVIWSMLVVGTGLLLNTPSFAQGGFVGMQVQGITPVIAEGLRLDTERGVIVRDVARHGPADKAGILPGDILLSIDGVALRDFDHLISIVSETRRRQNLLITVWRSGKEVSVGLVTEKWPRAWTVTAPETAILGDSGLSVATLTAEIRETFSVRWGVSGLIITDVVAGSIADRQGLKVGDVIEAINQEPIWRIGQVEKKLIQARNRSLSVVVLLVEQSAGKIVVPMQVGE